MKKQPKYLLIAILSIQVVLIIILAVILSNVMQQTQENEVDPDNIDEQPSVVIENLDEVFPELMQDFITQTNNQLFDLVSTNNVDVKLGATVAEIRDGTANRISFEGQKLTFYNFIVDIPILEQSYQMFLTTSEAEDNEYMPPNSAIIPLCLSDKETKVYGDFECVDIYSQATRHAIVAYYAPFLRPDGYYIIVPENISDNNIRLAVECRNSSEAYRNEIIEGAKSAIRDMGVSPDMFEYTIEENEYTERICEQ